MGRQDMSHEVAVVSTLALPHVVAHAYAFT